MNSVDIQYQNLLKQIKEEGTTKNIRAGEVKSIFGTNIKYNLRDGFPLLTTKKMYVKGIIHELLWFIKGDTNIKYLVDNDVNIWNGDAYRHYLDKCEYYGQPKKVLTMDEFITTIKENKNLKLYFLDPELGKYYLGDLGPVYGKQWRNWSGDEKPHFQDNHDQLINVIETLKTNPDNTRMIINSWNVSDLSKMALPPCHMMAQFYTRELTEDEKKKHPGKERELSCLWVQRSVDTFLGKPYNIASYAFLTHMLAHVSNMTVGDLVFNGGDTHIYVNQMGAVDELLANDPHKYELPTLWLNPKIKRIDDFKYEDIKIENYQSYPTIKAPLSVGL